MSEPEFPNDDPGIALSPPEAVFPHDLNMFLRKINVATSPDQVFEELLALATPLGFPILVYEYCHDHTRDDEKIFMRSNLPALFNQLERLFSGRKNRFGPGRLHARDNLTLGISGIEFSEMFQDAPGYVRKMYAAQKLMGIRAGFMVPLRTLNPNTRTGFGFCSKLKHEEFLQAIDKSSLKLGLAASYASTKILHLQSSIQLLSLLTQKQRQYLELLCQGKLDKQIAGELGISHSGVRKFQEAVARKLGATNRNQVVAEAFKMGLVLDNSRLINPEEADIWDMKVTAVE